ncbi:hypothetical protein NDU88_007684 [Pleurodeles waltl]|uniref:Uncharacterized protein n=1 Tax=Pleurodeles waltl TaxID=8319 RepID=A0AAV7VU73_PLEWA|nr:hypothetical protein NDU88_007684 [Pleurodeles waltl]
MREFRLQKSRPRPPKQQHRPLPPQIPYWSFQLRDPGPGPQARRYGMSHIEQVGPKDKRVYRGFSHGESGGTDHVVQILSAESGVSNRPRWESPASEESARLASASASSFE